MASTLRYQWYFNGTQPVAGATDNSLTWSGVDPTNAGSYSVIVSNQFGADTSQVATLSVNLAMADAFDPQPDHWAYCQVIQEDGKVLIGGIFSSVDGTARPGLARVDINGVIDTTFNAQAIGSVSAVAIQPDGKVLAGGAFRTTGTPARTNLARFNTDGSLDASFAPPKLSISTVRAFLVQPDSNIVVGISSPEISGSCLFRLAPNGSLDASFTPVVDEVLTLALQPDGKILVGGNFTTLCGQPRAYLGRLKADGTLDDTFLATAAADDWVATVALEKNGRILVGGYFTALAGSPRARLGRLNADGSLDTSFPDLLSDIQAGWGTVVSLAVQTDGKIVVGGLFSTVGGEPRANICRINSDGALDSGFCPNANGLVYGVSLQPDGKVLLAGTFTQVAGQNRTNVARLNNTGPATQALSYAASTLTWLRGGTSPEVWRTTFETSTDATHWTSLGSGARISGGWELTGVSLAANAVIRARGYDVGGANNSASWYVQSLLSLDRTPPVIPTADGRVQIVAGKIEFPIEATYAQIVVVEGSADMESWAEVARLQFLGMPGTSITFNAPANQAQMYYRVRLE